MDRFRSPQEQPNGSAVNQSSELPQKPPMHPVVADVKPRLTKEQHDILEAHFQQQHKPSTNTKKGFADTLGVPLDKINNWFQNRRAKVKQDIKKQMSAYNLYQQQTGHMPPVPPPHAAVPPPPVTQPMNNPPDYFAGMPQDLGSSGQPLDPHASTPQALGNVQPQHFAMPQPDFGNQSLASISETSQQGSYKDVVASLMAAGYNFPGGSGDGSSNDFMFQLDQQSMGPAFSDDVNLALAASMPMGDGFVDDGLGAFGDFSYDFSTYPNASSTSMQAMHSHDSLSSKPSTTYAHSTAPSAGGHASSSTSMYSPWTDDQDNSFDPSKEDFSDPRSAIAGNLAAASSTSSLPLWATNPHPAQYRGFYQQQNSSSTSQTLLYNSDGPDPRQLHSSGSDFDPPPVFTEDMYTRRNSSTSNLAENFRQIGIQSRSSVDGSFKQPNAPQSIAARRQRHPAALGQAALRSASFTSGMPSPGAGPVLSADQTLRRIRSSGIANGRVQKSNAPRSPMSFTFAEAAASPKFAKQTIPSNNGGTAVSTPGGSVNGNLAPPTPLTPNESGGQFWQAPTNAQAHPPPDGNSPPDSLGFSWSGEQSSSGVHSNAGSPLKGPSDAAAISQVARLQNAAVFKDTPPQSAPATQLSFPRHPFAVAPPHLQDLTGSEDFYQPSGSKLQHTRSPSVPDTTNSGNAASVAAMMDPSMQFGMGANGTSAGDLQMAYVMQLRRNLANGGLPSQYMAMMAQNAGAISSAVSLPGQPAASMPDLYVHEYVPPNASGQKQPQSQQQSPQQRPMDQAPKNYVFANHGPKDYQG